MKKKPFTYEEFKQIYSKVPRLAVDAIIMGNDGVVLALRRGSIGWNNQWHLPGGTVYYRESITEAVRRQAKEETGVDIEVERFIDYLEFYSEEAERGFGYTVSLVFLCRIISGTLEPDSDGSEVKFFKTVPANTINEHKEFLKKHFPELKFE